LLKRVTDKNKGNVMKDIKEDFVKYAKEQFNCDVSFKESNTPDTFESVFGGTFAEKSETDLNKKKLKYNKGDIIF
jgi:hypothetical protein